MKKLLLVLTLLSFPSVASAQCNGVFPPFTFCGNATASPAIPGQVPQSSASAPAGTNGQIQYNNGGVLGGFTPGGDVTFAVPNFTVNTFGAAQSGKVPASGGGTTNFLRADGTWTVPNYVSPGTGGATRTMQSKLADFINVKDFGAVCDATADDTTAIQNALNYASSISPNSGGNVYLPSGCQAKTSSTLVVQARTCLMGAGYASSKIIANFATGNIVNLNGDSPCFHDLSIGTLVNRTSGAALFLTNTGGNVLAYNFQIIGTNGTSQHFNGVEDQGTTSGYIHHFAVVNAVNDSIKIAGTSPTTQYSDFVAAWNGTRGGAHSGLAIYAAGGFLISNFSVLGFDRGIRISADGASVPGINDNSFINAIADHNIIALEIEAKNGAFNDRNFFTNVQFTASDLQNINLVTSTGGTLRGTYFTNCESNFSAGGDGLVIQDAGVQDTQWIGGLMGNNTGNGFKVNGASIGIRVVNARLGSGGSVAGNGVNGFQSLAVACNFVIVSYNDASGNGAAGINNNCTGANQIVGNNL